MNEVRTLDHVGTAKPVPSIALYSQQLGRALRPAGHYSRAGLNRLGKVYGIPRRWFEGNAHYRKRLLRCIFPPDPRLR